MAVSTCVDGLMGIGERDGSCLAGDGDGVDGRDGFGERIVGSADTLGLALGCTGAGDDDGGVAGGALGESLLLPAAAAALAVAGAAVIAAADAVCPPADAVPAGMTGDALTGDVDAEIDAERIVVPDTDGVPVVSADGVTDAICDVPVDGDGDGVDDMLAAV